MTDFSNRLQNTLKGQRPLTIRELTEKFAENSFFILFLLLMALPALPLPTGGITHVFEIIVMLLALELVAGRRTVWLPESWLSKKLPNGLQASALPRLIKIIRWTEKYSRPRLSKWLSMSAANRIIGFIIFVFAMFAFLAPPFSGLDTLPSLGVLFMSLALIFEDFLLMIIGVGIGSAGIIIIFILGSFVFRLL